jgi:serine/threonine-protein kinase RsbW
VNAKNKNINKQLVVKSTTDNLSKIRNFVKSNAALSGIDSETIGKIVLATDEACTNVIKHAYKYSPNGEIIIDIKFSRAKLFISITDKGSHFNSTIIPEPDLKEYYKQRKVGGLGMFLMKKLMDEVVYKVLDDNKNQVILIKYLT